MGRPKVSFGGGRTQLLLKVTVEMKSHCTAPLFCCCFVTCCFVFPFLFLIEAIDRGDEAAREQLFFVVVVVVVVLFNINITKAMLGFIQVNCDQQELLKK